VKFDWLTWPKFLWVLTVSFISGWLVAYSNHLALWEYRLFDAVLGYGALSPPPAHISTFSSFLWTTSIVAASSSLGLVHFKRSFIFIPPVYLTYLLFAFVLFWFGRWGPIVGPLVLAAFAYIAGQVITSWKLYQEWNVRSLSIKPLLALAQQADTAANFDEYLRSLWYEIEENTGVMLKSTRLSENFSLVQNYLSRAHTTLQHGGESCYIIKNASEESPRHRMLLPLPMWNDLWDDHNKSGNRNYVILAWDGRIATENLTSLAALVIFAALHFHAIEEGRRRKEMLTNTIAAIMEAVEAKDPTTKDHSKRVAEMSKNIASWMKLSRQEIEDVHFAAQIHDIGKLGIADSILKKQGVLTDEELSEMKQHPLIGHNIMRPVRLPPHIIKGITEHHENIDGKGYPNHLKGVHLSTVSKIIKVADVYDALSSRRPYKEPWSPEQVRAFLKERSGVEFDEQVVNVFLKHNKLE